MSHPGILYAKLCIERRERLTLHQALFETFEQIHCERTENGARGDGSVHVRADPATQRDPFWRDRPRDELEERSSGAKVH